MRNLKLRYLFFILFPFSGYSQSSDSSKTRIIGIFISVGANATQYYSDEFFQFLSNKTFTTVNGAPNPTNSYQSNYIVTAGPNASNSVYNKSVTSPVFNIGIQLNSGTQKNVKISHQIYATYCKVSSGYSTIVNYHEHWNSYGSPAASWDADVKDSIENKYAQTMISVGYRFQPTYKSIFFSLGVDCSVNLIETDEHKTSNISGIWTEESLGTGTYANPTTASDYKNNFYFINLPFQLGSGVNIRAKKIVFKPAFYFTHCFMKGYNFYQVSLGVMYKL